MIAKAMQLPYSSRTPALEEKAPRRVHSRTVLRLDGDPLPDLTGACFWDKDRPTGPHTLVFLLCMAAITLIRQVGDGLIGYALLDWFGVASDPCLVSGALHLGITLVGVGVAGCFPKSTRNSAVRRHISLTLLAALGIGLILVWLSHFVDYAGASTWPSVLVYLLWAGAEAVSNAQA
jgi:hypothetical protein